MHNRGDHTRIEPNILAGSILPPTFIMIFSSLTIVLIGALAPLISDTIGLTASELGFVAVIYYAAGAITSIPGGRLAAGKDLSLVMRAVCLGSALSLLSVAVVQRLWQLTLVAMVAGFVSGIAHPVTDVAMAQSVHASRRGFAFGVKQSAAAIATVLAGLSVALATGPLGWRSLFVGASAIVLLGLLLPGAHQQARPQRPNHSDSTPKQRGLLLLVLAASFGSSTVSIVTTFFVTSAVSVGHSHETAGLLFAVGGATAVIGRVLVGIRADSLGRGSLRLAQYLLTCGAIGCMIFALTTTPSWVVPSMLLIFGGGWTWSGLFRLGLYRSFKGREGPAAGALQAGMRVGAMVGPLLFGAAVASWTIQAGWIIAGGLLGLSTAMVTLARQQMNR